MNHFAGIYTSQHNEAVFARGAQWIRDAAWPFRCRVCGLLLPTDIGACQLHRGNSKLRST